MGDALGVFSTIFQPNQVCWTALMLGYVENSQAETALHFFLLMQLEGCSPDVWTLVCVLKACGSSVALRLGRILHEEITSLGFQFQGAVISSLVDFYSRCGSMDEAELVFNSVSRKDAVSWSSLIAGYSRQGDNDRVIQLFEKMCDEGVKPDGVTYVSVLATCSRAGMIEQGKKFFQEMTSRCGLDPGIEHYHCMIDMLGRAKQLEEALEMVEAMPFEATMVTWTSLLAACSKWKNGRVEKIACDNIVSLLRQISP
ncbi:putative pentatricopeptide repeat-containing protein At1g68930 [Selaginella moellendorffii]|uniref:putative pentatricopeptide repeat-containing protein At1g68930 n=2 Tax=Selaginella moellendorffii TaxID=88036 RepID=UPI000D1C3981|nr:putative pentatricopeptide repeat-containing protein At1g68930 [Selaginella moellendorffii]|eukprot:XP_024527555.1 putative pentatricopeptide repeat-containing protein At1g68930 [Selaginella moellendorffii]